MYLFFDTETTGLPKDYKAPVTDLYNWPRIVQLAFASTDLKGRILNKANYIIYPLGFEIPKDASDVHGITTERAFKEGVEIQYALKHFNIDLDYCEMMVAHNVDFDYKIVASEIIRNGLASYLYKPKFCTMKATTDFCQLPNQNGYSTYKWPKLEELHQKLFGEKFEDAHDAMVDVEALVRCFFELKKRNII